MLLLLGVNHRSAPLAIREKAAFSEPELRAFLTRLTAGPPFREAMLLSTCNRTEVLVHAEDRTSAGALLAERFACERPLTLEEIDRYGYRHEDLDAVRHLFHVAIGLDSMILGEPQILGQVRRAHAAAKEAGATGPVLERLLQQCLAAAKRIRTETGISRHAVSVAYAAVTLARRIFGDLRGCSVLLLGAGKMTELAARHLLAHGAADIMVSNRTYQRAEGLAARFGGTAVNWDDAFAALERADIVVTGTAAALPVVDRVRVQHAMRARRSRPLFFIDVAVPRDVDPDVNSLDGVYLYDIDDLQGVVDANLDERRRAAGLARQRVEDEVRTFERWRQSLEVTPTIVSLRESWFGVAEREVERFRRRLGPLSADQARAVEDLTRAVVAKLLHRPVSRLRGSAQDGDAAGMATLYRDIFGIGPEAARRESFEDERTREDDNRPRIVRGGIDRT